MKAEVIIQTAVRDGVTVLRQNYYTPPFKVANITEDRRDPLLQLMLMCSSPGILDGDDYVFRLELGEGSRLRLYTQSYQRLFNMKQGAVQSMDVRLGQHAAFFYLPHPSVPHAHSDFTARNKIFLSEDSQLVWGEVLTCGRKLNGEVLAFSKYRSVTEVFLRDKLVLRENLCLQPLVEDVCGIGQLEGYTHQASLLLMGYRGEGGDDGAAGQGVEGVGLSREIGVSGVGRESAEGEGARVKEKIQAYLLAQEGILSGISAGPAGSLVVRILGNKAEQLHDCLKEVAGFYCFFKEYSYAG